jgi:ATP-dependent DNA ligase
VPSSKKRGLSGRPFGTLWEGDGEEAFEASCDWGLEGIVSKRLTAPYKSPSKIWIKVRNPKSPAYLRIVDGTF